MKKYKFNKQYRQKGYDYSQDGFYFVTICVKNRNYFFGNIEKGKIIFTEMGLMARKFWQEIPSHFHFVKLDEYVIMPNHIHGIIIIENAEKKNNDFFSEYQNKFGPQANNLSAVIRGFKIGVTKYANSKNFNSFAWQPRFYDRIIRNENELGTIQQYIIDNPEKWELEKNNLENLYM